MKAVTVRERVENKADATDQRKVMQQINAMNWKIAPVVAVLALIFALIALATIYMTHKERKI